MKTLIAFGLALVFAGVALAGALPSANSGTISAYVPSSFGASSAQPSYQGPVAFHTTGTGKLKNPRVWVACYQNGALVYGEGGSPSTIFKLGGDSSQWVANGGGATCTADLYYILNANDLRPSVVRPVLYPVVLRLVGTVGGVPLLVVLQHLAGLLTAGLLYATLCRMGVRRWPTGYGVNSPRNSAPAFRA